MIGRGRYDNSGTSTRLLSAANGIELDPDQVASIQLIMAWHGGGFCAAWNRRLR